MIDLETIKSLVDLEHKHKISYLSFAIDVYRISNFVHCLTVSFEEETILRITYPYFLKNDVEEIGFVVEERMDGLTAGFSKKITDISEISKTVDQIKSIIKNYKNKKDTIITKSSDTFLQAIKYGMCKIL